MVLRSQTDPTPVAGTTTTTTTTDLTAPEAGTQEAAGETGTVGQTPAREGISTRTRGGRSLDLEDTTVEDMAVEDTMMEDMAVGATMMEVTAVEVTSMMEDMAVEVTTEVLQTDLDLNSFLSF